MKENRKPLDPNETYTIISASEARRVLHRDHGLARHATATLTLEQLHDTLTQNLADDLGRLLVVVTDRAFRRVSAKMDDELRRIVGKPIWPSAALMSRSGAIKRLENAGVVVPEDAPTIEIEDALAGLDGERPNVISDEDFSTYSARAHEFLSEVPTGRSKA